MKVSEISQRTEFKVKRVLISGEVGKRLADMGFTEGAEGMVIRGGFFRGPLQVRIRGYDLLLRRCEAAAIEIDSQDAAIDDAVDMFTGLRGFGFWGHGPGKHAHGRGLGRRFAVAPDAETKEAK